MFLRELGRGEHSQVYLARTPPRLGLAADTVAVKVLSLTGTDGFDALADELALFAALGSPRLVPMYDVGMDAGAVFYAMRHEPLGALSAPARDLTRRERLQAVAQAARGAHEMHEAGRRAPRYRAREHPARQGRRRAGRAGGRAPAHARAHAQRPRRRGPIGWSSSIRKS